MGAQNIIALGIDTTSFSTEKEAVLNRYIALFNSLEKYDGKVFNPVLGGGLLELNNSIKQTTTILEDINSKMTAFNANVSTTSGTVKSAANSTKELNAEQSALKVKLQESNKAMLEQAKAQNASVQARQAAKAALKAQFDAETQLANQQKADSKLILALQKQEAAETSANTKSLIAAKKQQEAAVQSGIRASQQEDKVNKTLLNDYALLKLALQDQAVAYQNLYINKGKDAPETKDALSSYKESASTINQIDNQLIKAGASSQGLGRELTHALGYLRNIAYILPGIGLAGIFNLAYEAIGKAADELGIFSSATSKYLDYELSINKALKDKIALYNQVFDAQRTLKEAPKEGGLTQQDKDEITSSRGTDEGTSLAVSQQRSEANLQKITAQIIGGSNSPEALADNLKRRLDVQKGYVDQISSLSARINAIENPKPNQAKQRGNIQLSSSFLGDVDDLKKKKDVIQAQLDISSEAYKRDKDLLDKYSSAQLEYFKTRAEVQKFNQDEERKRNFNFTKDSLAQSIDRNEQLLHAEISSEITRIAALKKIRDDELRLNKNEFDNVNNNITSTASDKEIAQSKLAADNKKVQIKFEEDYLQLTEDYRQRRLKAQEGIDKNEVETTAIANEKIFNNDKQSLDERIKAYATYIQKKQTLQDLEYSLAADTLALKSNDPTARKEREKLDSDRNTQKVNIQADAEKQVYDIVYSSLQRQLKAIIDENSSESFVNKAAYTQQLTDLNNSYEKKKISYEKYKRDKAAIDRKYTILDLDQEIINDDESVRRLEEQLHKAQRLKEGFDKAVTQTKDQNEFNKLTGQPTLDSQRNADTAVGEQQAAADSIQEIKKKLTAAEQKAEDDRLKRAKQGFKDDDKERKEWIKAAEQIEKALYNSIKSLADAGYEYRIAVVEKHKQLIDEQYGYEIAAIEKSTLTAKDKAALDIQLQAQKAQFDKNAQVEERRVKREEAEFDKKLAIAHILFGTAAAVIDAGAVTPKAIAAGVVGAVELGAALATQIPSFKEGVKGFKGGLARYGEDGVERVTEPYKSPYLVYKETISFLPKGTDIVPVKQEELVLEKQADNSWEQTKWLGREIRKNNKEIKNIFKPIININLGFENYKNQRLYN